jgi:hypothetical protein
MSNFKSLGIVSKALLFLFAAVVSNALLTPAAHADITYNFTYDGCSAGCGPQDSFGTVNLSQVNPATVDISVSLLNGNKFVDTSRYTSFAFNFAGRNITVGALPDGWFDAGAKVSEPGFGVFAHAITCDTGNSSGKQGCAGNNPWAGVLDFEVSRASGLSVADFQTNGGGYTFATDIFSGTNSKTGLVGANVAFVPEPAALALVGSGLLSLAWKLSSKFRG